MVHLVKYYQRGVEGELYNQGSADFNTSHGELPFLAGGSLGSAALTFVFVGWGGKSSGGSSPHRA